MISEDQINEYNLLSALAPSFIQENLEQDTAEKLKSYNYFSIYNPKSFLSCNSGTDWIGNAMDLIYLAEEAFSDSHFNQTFVLIDGSYPTNANEHLISYHLAQSLNFSIGHSYNISITIWAGSTGQCLCSQ